MNVQFRIRFATVAAGLIAIVGTADGQGQTTAGCKAVQAEMTEARTTTGCRDGRPACFVGEVKGNLGLRGTTYFHGDSSGTPPPASPTFSPYAGRFEYEMPHGTISMRETGIVSGKEGVVMAFQKIVAGTGDYAGATGHFFVSGTTNGSRVVTTVGGEICRP